MKYYICEICGDLTTSEVIDDELSNGGMGYCGCQYMQLQWDSSFHDFDPIYFRCYTNWTEIPALIYEKLIKESNTVKRLWMLHSIPVAERSV